MIYEPYGGSSYVYELLRELQSKVNLLHPTSGKWIDRHEEVSWEPKPVLRSLDPESALFRKGLTRALNFSGVSRLLWENRPDILHLHFFSHPEAFLPVLMLGKVCAGRTVITVHNVLPHGSQKESDVLRSIFYKFADALIVHHEKLKGLLIDLFGIPENEVFVVPRGPPRGGRASKEDEQPRKEAREKLGIPLDRFIVLQFGGLRKNKRLDLTLGAAQELPDDYHFVIAGDLQSWREKEGRRLQRLTEKGMVTLEDRFVPFSRVPQYYSAADVVVLPYEDFYAQSANLLTSLEFGKPCVVSPGNPMEDIVQKTSAGAIMEDLTVDSLSEGIQEVAQGPYDVYRWNATRAFSDYSWSECGDMTMRVYRELLNIEPTGEMDS